MTTKPKNAARKAVAKKLSPAEKMSNHLPPGIDIASLPNGKVSLTLNVAGSPDRFRSVGGAKNELANMLIVDEILHAIAQTDDVMTAGMRSGGAVHMVEAFRPTDPVEAMIATQSVGLHMMAMETMRRAMLPGQPADVASRLRKDAANTARAMVEMAEALDRRRGKGLQRIVVERVQVAPGGQAIVGHVQAAAMLPAGTAMPMSLVEVRDGEGAEHVGSNEEPHGDKVA